MTQPPPARSPVLVPSLDADVAIEDDRWRSLVSAEHDDIEQVVQAAAAALCASEPAIFPPASEVTILLSDDARVAVLNGSFRDKPAPTNVLSFPADPAATEPGAPRYLGDIIIARETVEREAQEQSIPVAHHVQHLAIHGLLHLLGYDHQTDTEAERMEAIETRVLASLGIADPYAATELTHTDSQQH